MSAERAGLGRIYAFVDQLRENVRSEEEAPEPLEEWVLFELDRRSFCLPVESVLEVVRVGKVTRVPGAPAAVKGLFNLRGQVLPLVDLGAQLGVGAVEVDGEARIVITDSRRRRLGLLVSRALRLVEIPPSGVEPAPADAPPELAAAARGVYQDAGERWTLLDADRLLLGAGPERPTSDIW